MLEDTDMFDDNESVTEEQVSKIIRIFTILTIWNLYMQDSMVEIVTKLSDDPASFSDDDIATMHQIMLTGMELDKLFVPAGKRMRLVAQVFLNSGEFPKNDYYDLAFEIAGMKSYIFEIDKASQKIGLNPPLTDGNTITKTVKRFLSEV